MCSYIVLYWGYLCAGAPAFWGTCVQGHLYARVPVPPLPRLLQKLPSCQKTLQRDEVKNGAPPGTTEGPSSARGDSVALWPPSGSHGHRALSSPALAHAHGGWLLPLQRPVPVSHRLWEEQHCCKAKREKQLHWSLPQMGEAVGCGHSPLPLRCPVSSSVLFVPPSLH